MVLFFPFVSCDLVVDPTRNDNIVYLNSFESSADIADLEGEGGYWIYNDAAPKGGKSSLRVSGGCPSPHAYIDLEPMAKDSYLILKCWGKNLEIGGVVGLEVLSNDSEIYLQIDGTNWQSYQTADTLLCPANQSTRLWMSAGGIAHSAMLVDLIEVVRVY